MEAVSQTEKKVKDHLSVIQKQIAHQNLILQADYFTKRVGKLRMND